MTDADVPRVMDLAARLPGLPKWSGAAYFSALNPESTVRRVALVAAGPEPGQVEGFIVASLLLPQAELELIVTCPEAQRQGVGSALVGALVEELRTAGAVEIILEVRAANRGAITFYQSAGFNQSGLRRAYYVDPIEDAVLMRLCIS
jgi:ribosomal-protein-alanine N-acetyltransferase